MMFACLCVCLLFVCVVCLRDCVFVHELTHEKTCEDRGYFYTVFYVCVCLWAVVYATR